MKGISKVLGRNEGGVTGTLADELFEEDRGASCITMGNARRKSVQFS